VLVTQPVFFVATAPLDASGHVNCSPKGNRREFAVLGRTVSPTWTRPARCGNNRPPEGERPDRGHVLRLRGPPRIVRLHGRGQVTLLDEPGSTRSPSTSRMAWPGRAGVITVDVERVPTRADTPCPSWASKRIAPCSTTGRSAKAARHPRLLAQKNATSIDGARHHCLSTAIERGSRRRALAVRLAAAGFVAADEEAGELVARAGRDAVSSSPWWAAASPASRSPGSPGPPRSAGWRWRSIRASTCPLAERAPGAPRGRASPEPARRSTCARARGGRRRARRIPTSARVVRWTSMRVRCLCRHNGVEAFMATSSTRCPFLRRRHRRGCRVVPMCRRTLWPARRDTSSSRPPRL